MSAPPATPSPAPATAPAPTTSPSNSRTLAAVAYILTWLTGLIIFFVAQKDDKYARWHAIQAIGLGVAATLGWIVFSILGIPFIGTLWSLLVLVGIIIFAIKAYQGDKIRLPIVADMADKNA